MSDKICEFCGKKITFWQEQWIKHEGKEICRDCRMKIGMKEAKESGDKFKAKTGGIFSRMFFGGITGLLLLVGIVTFPLGILFWIIGIFTFRKTLKG